MSINVTVSGNPIKIHRGKLVACDLQDADKLRKMRIQQVRQQSKDLAASVRNNVKKAKNKQQTEYEKQNQSKLKEWQNKKLLQLQGAYEENVKDIGAGHAQARICEIEEIQELERTKVVNQARAARRGQSAQELLQVQRNEASLQRAIPRQAKQIAREVENARAAMVVSQAVRRSPTKKKRVTKGNFTIVEHQEDELPDENDVENGPVCEVQNVPNGVQSTKSSKITDENVNDDNFTVQTSTSVGSLQREETISSSKSPTKRFRHSDTSRVSIVSIDVPPDTRISDRIRSRHLLSSRLADIPEAASSTSSNIEIREVHQHNKENSRQTNKTYSKSTQQGVSIEPVTQNEVVACPVCVKHQCPRVCQEHNPPTCAHTAGNVCPPCQQAGSHSGTQEFEIPRKPTVTLARESYTPQYSQQDTQSQATSKQEYRRVRSFDRNNRFGHHFITDTSHVQRINDDELSYCDQDHELQAGPSHRHEREFSKMADERYKMADIRGKKAMQKETIHKDYADLMKKLPLLQKQGRIAGINPGKEKLHMSEARKKEHEQQRQQKMERAFERLAPAITLQAVDCRDDCKDECNALKRQKSPSRDCRKDCTAECNLPSTSAAKSSTSGRKSPPRTRRKSPVKPSGTWKKPQTDAATSAASPETNLLNLLEKLRSQKAELLKECKDLPQDSNFYNFIEDLDFVAKSQVKNSDKNVQTDSMSVRTKRSVAAKPKQVLVLQNTSTQTSPNVVKATAATSCEKSISNDEPCEKHPKTSQKSNKKDTVCSCKDRDKLCEILIKIRDCPAHSTTDTKDSDDTVDHHEVVVRQANQLEEALNLETGRQQSGRKTTHLKSGDSDRSISPKRSRSESPKKTPRKTSAKPTKPTKPVEVTTSRSKTSWGQHLSSSTKHPEEITSSTSYYSPPDYNLQARNQAPSTSTPCPQRPPEMDDKLLRVINKLLEVSKDKLNMVAANVSSISDVPTPSASVINMRTNRRQTQSTGSSQSQNPNDSTYIEKLSTLLRHFNLTPGDFRSFVSVASASSVIERTRTNSSASSGTTTSNGNGNVAERTPQLSLENFTQTPSGAEPIVDQFAQWAQICQTRINNLTAMIDQVRMEKHTILSPNGEHATSVNRSNNATVYMNLPQTSSASSTGSPSLEQRQLNENLLNVDVCEKLCSTSGRSADDVHKLLEFSKNDPDVDRGMIERYLQLVDVELQAQRSKSPEDDLQHVEVRVSSPPSPKSVSFQPMLDIPKLPKFQPPQTPAVQPKSKKPPVTTNALRFNDVIHELSAIPEAENSRLSKSPQSKSTSPQKRRVAKKSPKKSAKSTATEASTDSPASEKSNESVESMLKNIGLDWAINTLKIMNAANNNSSSSSSSFDIEQKKFSFMLGKNASTSTEKMVSPNELSRHQRTSTPVQTTNSSKSIPSHKLINSGESEISPVVNGAGGSGRQDNDFCGGFGCPEDSFHTLSQSIRVHDQSES